MVFVMRCAAFFLVQIAMGASVFAATGAESDLLAWGKRIYREGILPSGQPLRGLAAANVTLSGGQAACTSCHRRSGYGASEGRIDVRSIAGPALFGQQGPAASPGTLAPWVMSTDSASSSAEMLDADLAAVKARALRAARAERFAGTRQRPIYDDLSLGRAIREGVDVTGRRLNTTMPRFDLSTVEMAAVTAYLKTLSAQASPGVTADAVHFATVIQPGTDPAQRQALVDVLQAYIQDRNRGLRVEARRESAGMAPLKRTYRDWVLHLWELQGTSDTWTEQLQAFNARQPVFALLSGLGQVSWQPVHDFSERMELPCILPQVEVPVLAEHDFYTAYLSRGMTLEAQALVKFLTSQSLATPLIQVYGPDEASFTAARAFRTAWAAAADAPLAEFAVQVPPDSGFWQRLNEQTPGATLVLWLAPRYLEHVQALTEAGAQPVAIYLSANLVTQQQTGMAADRRGLVRWVYPQDLPAVRSIRVDVVRRWLESKGQRLWHEKVQMNAYLAATVTGLLMSHIMDTYSRDYLIERMEHLLGNSLETSIYPRLSLGPGQRYASKGSFIVAVAGATEQLFPLSDWIVP